MTSQVKVVITGTPKGKTFVAPYDHHLGLQYLLLGGIKTDRLVIYEVPTYEVWIDGGHSYTAIRFGLKHNRTILKNRRCDSGLSQARHCTPSWIPNYSPHSFSGSSRQGAWRLLPGKGFLIHEGAGQDQIGGSLGCVEILDGRWNNFLAELERLAGAPAAKIGASHLLKVSIEYASFPTASLASF